ERGLDRTAAIPGCRLGRVALPARCDLDETRHEQHRRLVEAYVAAPRGDRLRELAEHHELRERRYAAGSPQCGRRLEPIGELLAQLEEQTLVADHVVVRADVFVAGMADEHRARDELEGFTARAIAEAAAAHVRNVEAGVLLDERRRAGRRIAAV